MRDGEHEEEKPQEDTDVETEQGTWSTPSSCPHGNTTQERAPSTPPSPLAPLDRFKTLTPRLRPTRRPPDTLETVHGEWRLRHFTRVLGREGGSRHPSSVVELLTYRTVGVH